MDNITEEQANHLSYIEEIDHNLLQHKEKLASTIEKYDLKLLEQDQLIKQQEYILKKVFKARYRVDFFY